LAAVVLLSNAQNKLQISSKVILSCDVPVPQNIGWFQRYKTFTEESNINLLPDEVRSPSVFHFK
jgi:hypothetical protein